MKVGGYLLVDHTASPGLPGLPKLFEADTLTCFHCKTVQIKNPNRTRERETCPRCFKYICDICAGAYKHNKICRPWNQVVDDVMDGKQAILAKHIKE